MVGEEPQGKNPGGILNRSVPLGQFLINAVNFLKRAPNPKLAVIVSEDGQRFYRTLEGSPQGIQIETSKVNNRGTQMINVKNSVGSETLDIRPSLFTALDPLITDQSIIAIDAFDIYTDNAINGIFFDVIWFKAGVLIYFTDPSSFRLEADVGSVHSPVYPTATFLGQPTNTSQCVGPTPEWVISELQYIRIVADAIEATKFLYADIAFRVLRY